MALIKARNYNDVGVAYTLGNGDELVVGRNVAVISQDLSAIEVTGRARNVLVEGFVKGADDGIYINGTSNTFAVTVAQTGVVQGDFSAIDLQGEYTSMTVTNHGTLVGRDGIYSNASDDRDIRLVNTGSILADRYGVILDTGGDHVVINSGRIIGGVLGVETYSGNDVLRNSGVIVGGVNLLDGNDLYDGRGGTVFGFMEGGSGNDRFIPGAGHDSIFGGQDVDTVDFRLLRGAIVALDGSRVNGGSATGDVYAQMENLQGSARFGDVLIGDALDNRLSGNGGNDRLFGGAGEDALAGGAGRDVLTGGADTDRFVFNGPSAGTDRITDFTGGATPQEAGIDQIVIDLRAFGLREVGRGGFNVEWFHKGATNQAAEADDRFIFRTSDTTLWFDRDGRGGAGPVLIADLQDGAKLNAFNFDIL